jgi:Ca2+-binding EF-hand superfamily protein
MRGNAIARLFDQADINKDGKVSLDEAQNAALKQFDAADLNHDGVLTPDERRQASKAERAKKRTG